LTFAVSSNGGQKVTDFLVEYSTDGGSTFKQVSKSVSASATLTLKGLRSKTNYQIRVSAKNTVGYSIASQLVTFTTL
jgi:hypothetical protein